MAKPKVLVTRRWPEAVEQALQAEYEVTFNSLDQPFSKTELFNAMAEYDAVCPCVADRLDAEVFAIDSDRLKTRIIGNYGVGYNHIDIDAAKSIGITVTNTPDVLSDATADLAMTLMFMLARRAGEGERQLRKGEWSGWYPTHLMGASISGKTLGIVGMGRIGKAMARKAHLGFDMNIIYHNRRPIPEEEARTISATYCEELTDLLKNSDFVAVHCPSSPVTFHMINESTLEYMKPSAFLINTSRGDVVDEKALVHALHQGKIAGAGLDVFEQEPHVPDELIALDNVVLLPHLGSATLETRTAMGMRVLDNLNKFFAGETPTDLV